MPANLIFYSFAGACVCVRTFVRAHVQHGTEEVTSEEEEEEEMGEVGFLLLAVVWLKLLLLTAATRFPDNLQDIEDLDHYEMKEEEPVDGKKSEDDGIEKENLAILEKIRKNQRQDHLNVSVAGGSLSPSTLHHPTSQEAKVKACMHVCAL